MGRDATTAQAMPLRLVRIAQVSDSHLIQTSRLTQCPMQKVLAPPNALHASKATLWCRGAVRAGRARVNRTPIPFRFGKCQVHSLLAFTDSRVSEALPCSGVGSEAAALMPSFLSKWGLQSATVSLPAVASIATTSLDVDLTCYLRKSLR